MSDERIYAAAQTIVRAGLAADGSAFTLGRPVWTAANARDLHERFVDQPDLGKGSFTTKLKGQLAGAPPGTAQLMAELTYLHLLLPKDIGGAAKRTVIGASLDLAPGVKIPADLDVVLDEGVVRAGTAYMTQRDRQLSWLVRLVKTWKDLPEERRREALEDPWVFRDVIDSIEVMSAYTQRNVLLNLVYPQTFPAVVSRKHRQLIVAAFPDEVKPTGDTDRDLAALWKTLSATSEAPVRFYFPPWVDKWRLGEDQQRGWRVRGARVHGKNLVPEWLDNGYCSIAFPQLGELKPGLSRTELEERLAEALPDLTPAQRGSRVGVLDRFLNQMREGDLVVTVDPRGVFVGTVTGPLTWTNSTDGVASRRRSVTWHNADAPVSRLVLSSGARDKLAGPLTVTDLGTFAAEFESLAGRPADDTVKDPADDTAKDPLIAAELPEPTAQLAKDLLIDLDWLVETVDLLRDKKQIILYGPPGTGKTHIAQELAQFLTADNDDGYRLVQFHPSYSYEDFFEGFRPRSVGTGVGFALEPGPLKQLVAIATENPAQAFVLIIDEINRANLAKVFGELYFLLEYRDRAVQLQYSPNEAFSLPPNVYIIGTMNTADRSIALVDAAMRRRFYFQSLFPGEAPLTDMLRRWLAAQKLPADRADLLDELNRVINDRDAAVGPSYLMTPRVADEKGLDRIWRTAILPLMEERHLGDGVDVRKRYGIETLRKRLAQP
jgi:5-methylcytosine-specific restriction protein B